MASPCRPHPGAIPTSTSLSRQMRPRGVHQLSIRSSNGMSTVNGLTFHVLAAPVTTVTAPAFPSMPAFWITLISTSPTALGSIVEYRCASGFVFSQRQGPQMTTCASALAPASAYDSWWIDWSDALRCQPGSLLHLCRSSRPSPARTNRDCC